MKHEKKSNKARKRETVMEDIFYELVMEVMEMCEVDVNNVTMQSRSTGRERRVQVKCLQLIGTPGLQRSAVTGQR